MKVYAQRQNQPRPKESLHPALTQHRILNPQALLSSKADEERKAVTSAPAATRFGHDFSRVPAHSPLRSEGPPRSQGLSPAVAKGEALTDEELFSPIKGEPGVGTQDEPASKGEDKKTKKVTKTELGAPTAGECGAYSWKVRFSVENADATTNGYIVQKVDAKYNRTDCAGSNKPVTGMGTFPFWEAWGVRGGKVYIGDSASEHNADTYADSSMGDSTKGSIVVKGTAEFFPDAKLPAHMKANNPDTQALSLRSTITDPGLTGGTGAISHNLTASWNCCPTFDKKTTFSDKK